MTPPRFHESIRRVGKLTKRETVLSLMVAAGYENDERRWVRLLVENAVSREAARAAWRRGWQRRSAEQAEKLRAIAPEPACSLCQGEPTKREGTRCYGCNQPSENAG